MAVLAKTGYSEEDKVLIRKHYRKLLRIVKPKFTEAEVDDIRRAFELAVRAHQNDRRKTGEPYITHPIEVAVIVAQEMGLDSTAIQSALMHDVVEDTEVTLEEIDAQFGNQVSNIIEGLTKISGVVDITNTGSIQALNFRKILLTIVNDIRVILVKLADRLHNMRTLDSMKREKRLKIASETLFLYAPLSHRLGFYNLKSELEDLGLKYTEPEIYQEIAHKLKETQAARTRYINEFIKPVRAALAEEHIKYEITGRTKHVYSIWNKMRNKNVSFEEVYDLFAVRIVLDIALENEKAACWQVYSMVTDQYKPNPERLKDFVSNPKTNGYESLHTTVMGPKGRWVEVQIRSRRMHEIAEIGLAAHWKYKENDTDSALDAWIKHVRELLKNPEANAIDFINSFKAELFEDEIYVFTPKGDLFMMPKGSTALDFAFNIHTQVGYECIGAKVNQKLLPISHELESGDQVEIITSKKQKPNEGWLKFVKSSKARNRIKAVLKEEKREFAQDGKAMLDRRLKAMKVKNDHDNYHEIANYFNFGSILDLHYEIAKKTINLAELKNFLVQGDKLVAPVAKEIKTKEVILEKDVVEHLRKNSAQPVIMGNISDKIDYSYAKCCNPIPGDHVFGFISVGEGVKIHRTTCPNAVQLMSKYGYRIVKVNWTDDKEIAFLSGIRVSGIDDMGLVNKITKIISTDMKVNIQSLAIETNDGVFDGTINVFVNNTKELDKLITKIKKLEGMINVSRA